MSERSAYEQHMYDQAANAACERERYLDDQAHRPSSRIKPLSISIDGNLWCVLYGENLQDGVAGFGVSPEAAMENFDFEWGKKL